MHHGATSALERLEGFLDQLLTRLHQDLDGHVLGNPVVIDQVAHEIVVVAGGRGKAHLDLLEADLDQLIPEARLLAGGHGLDQGLVAIAQVNAAPDRRLGDGSVGPLPVSYGDRREGPVFVDGHAFHGS